MQLTQHRNQGELFVRKADATSVVVGDRIFTRSLVLCPDRTIEDFPIREVAELDTQAIEKLLEQQPEVVLLGTGTRAIFPTPSVLAQFLKRGIGLETMDNAAAARTFNVLASEGRHVVASIFIAGVNARHRGQNATDTRRGSFIRVDSRYLLLFSPFRTAADISIDQLAQPQQRFALNLAHALTRQIELRGDLGQGLHTMIVQTIAPFKYIALTRRQVRDPCRDALIGNFVDRRSRCLDHQLFDQRAIIACRKPAHPAN